MPSNSSNRRGRPGRSNPGVSRPSPQDEARGQGEPEPAAAGGYDDPLLGRVIAGHEILKRVATGRLCCTYKANHSAMGRVVALKALNAGAAQTTVDRFHKAAKHAAQLHHANIASIYDVSSEGGIHFCTMEFVEGTTVGALLQSRQKMASADAIRVALDMAQALRFANARGVPGWRLSANRVVLTTRGEVKLLPPTFLAAGAPVLDDRYVATAAGVLLYALLTGGRVHDIESALEPGSSLPAKLRPLKSAAPGMRSDIAQVADRLLGIKGEPYPTADAAISALQALLAVKERIERRTRGATERLRARAKKSRRGLFIAIGLVAALAVAIVAYLLVQSSIRAGVRREFQAAVVEANAALKDYEEARGRFLANPSPELAQQVTACLEKARDAYATFAAQYPHRSSGATAAENVKSIDDAIRRFADDSRAELRYAEGKLKVQQLEKALEREIADRRDNTGGTIDVAAWTKRYQDAARGFDDSPRTLDYIQRLINSLPRRMQQEQMQIDEIQTARQIEKEFLPKFQFGKALEAWDAYRRKYEKFDHLRKQVLQVHDKATTMIQREARVQNAQLCNQARYHVEKQEYARARDIYERIIRDFGITEFVARAKAELAKLPSP